jgi:hypothetical protein
MKVCLENIIKVFQQLNLIQSTTIEFLPGKSMPYSMPMTAGSPHPEQVRLCRNKFRQNFDTMVKQLPWVKKE